MEHPATTFAQFARTVAVKHVPAATVEAALVALGSKAESVLGGLDAERKGTLINHFVRSIRNVGVHTVTRLEHALLEAAGCCPAGRRVVALKDAISLITIRNHIHLMATAIGLPWSESMRVQSAISDVARFVVDRGGGRIEMEEVHEGLAVSVYSAYDLGPMPPPGGPAPPWLAGTVNLAKTFRCVRSGNGSHLEFCFSRPQPMVA